MEPEELIVQSINQLFIDEISREKNELQRTEEITLYTQMKPENIFEQT